MTTTQAHPTTSLTAAQPRRGLVVTGATAVVGAVAATLAVGAIATAAGVDFEMPDGGERLPLSGVAVVTTVFTVLGALIAAGLRRWAARPATTFVRTTLALTAVSLVPPFLVEADAATVTSLVLLHLTAAAVAIPLLARSLSD